jgi:hypothetical protein
MGTVRQKGRRKVGRQERMKDRKEKKKIGMGMMQRYQPETKTNDLG